MLPLLSKGLSSSRSYGVNLPSSFNIVHSHALVYATFPPDSVYSTVLFLPFFLPAEISCLLNFLPSHDLSARSWWENTHRIRFSPKNLGTVFYHSPGISFRVLNSLKPGIFGGTLSVLIATYASICNSDLH